MKPQARLLIVGDCHGKVPRLPKKGYDAILFVGDSIGKESIDPFVQKSLKQYVSNPATAKSWYEFCGKRKAKRLVIKALREGRKVLESLNKTGVPVYLVPGNWDMTQDDDEPWRWLGKDHHAATLKGLDNIKNVDGRLVHADGFDIIGYGSCSGPELLKYRGYSNVTKKIMRSNISNYKHLLKEYEALFRKSKKPLVFLSHNVPYNTKLDKINNKASIRHGWHYGSLLGKEMILKHKPALYASGHLHENRGKCLVGKTLVVNPGANKTMIVSIRRRR